MMSRALAWGFLWLAAGSGLRASTLELHGQVGWKGPRPSSVEVQLLPWVDEYSAAGRLLTGAEPTEPLASGPVGPGGGFLLRAPRPGLFSVRVTAPGFLSMEIADLAVADSAELPPLTLEPAELGRLVVTTLGRPSTDDVFAAIDSTAVPAEEPGIHWTRSRLILRGAAGAALAIPHGRGESVKVHLYAQGYREQSVTLDGHAEIRLAAIATPTAVQIEDHLGHPRSGVLLLLGPRRWPIGVTGGGGEAAVWVEPGAVVDALAANGLEQRLATREAGGAATRLEARLPPPVLARGRVLSAAERTPIQGALVVLLPGPRAWAASDAAGWVTFANPGRDISRVMARAAGFFPAETPVVAGSGPSEQLPHLLLATALTVRGQVVAERERPVPGASILATVQREPGPRRTIPGAQRLEARSDARGEFTLPGLAAAVAYHLRVEADGFIAFERDFHERELGAANPLRIVVSAGRSLHGKVLDQGGAPVVGARVQLLLAAEGRQRLQEISRARSGRVPGAFTTTGPDGVYRLAQAPDHLCELVVTRPGFAPGLLKVDAGEAELPPLFLQPEAEVEGVVRDADGQPVAGARVGVSSVLLGTGIHSEVPLVDKRSADESDHEGAFHLAGLIPGEPLRLSVWAAGFVPWEQTVAAEPGKKLDIVLRRGARLRGRVVDDLGAAVGGARVVAYELFRGTPTLESSVDAETDSGGRFELTGLAGSRARLVVGARGFADTALPDIPVDSDPDSSGQELEIRLHRGATVDGRVLDSAGEPVQDARVVLGSQLTLSDLQGAFHLEGAAEGSQKLAAAHPDHGRTERLIEIPRGARLHQDLQFSADGGSVEGSVRASDGATVPGALVSLLPATPGRPNRLTLTDDSGRFRLGGVRPGVYRPRAEADGFAPLLDAPPFEVAAEGPPVQLDIQLQAGGAVVGQLLGVATDDLPWMMISAVGPDGRIKFGLIDAKGGYRLSNLAPGLWRVFAWRVGRAERVGKSIQIEPGEVAARLDLELRSGD
ncbi:MAG TPA: carboxypeptidase-like regulatory domain-containing protein [Thermoanaerobaculia bacterium]|nr:carboxypeptidase-like regulatory domain-containing protein [Thermoanaerobaculia bacterium]